MVCIGPYCTWASTVCKGYRDCVEVHIQVCEHHPSDGHFPYHHDLTRHHRKMVPGYWPARHLHWIENNCRGFSIWRAGRKNGRESSHNYLWSSTSSRLERCQSLAGSSPPKPDALSQCIAWSNQKWRNVSTGVWRITLKWPSGRVVDLMELVPFLHTPRQWRLVYLLDVIMLLLRLIRTSGGGNWQPHLFAIGEIFPWYFAYDRLNYAWYLPAYYAQMINLQTDHPHVYQHFSNGGFSVQLADDNPFGRIPIDQTTEVTVDKYTQTVGGTTKYSQKCGAVKIYYWYGQLVGHQPQALYIWQLNTAVLSSVNWGTWHKWINQPSIIQSFRNHESTETTGL